MTKFSSLSCRFAAATVLAGLILPPVAAAGGKWSGGRSRQSSPSNLAPRAKQLNSLSVEPSKRATQSLSSGASSNLTGKLKSTDLKFDRSKIKLPSVGGARSPLIPRPDPRKIDPQIDLGRIRFPRQIKLPPNAPAGPQGGGRPNPRIPRPDPGILDPNIDLGRVRFPNEVELPPPLGGNQPDPGNPGGNPGDNPADDPGNEPGDDPGNDPGDDPGDNPGNPPPGGPPVVVPFPIFWPSSPGGGSCPIPYSPGPTVAAEAMPQTAAIVDLLLEDVEYVEAATLLVGPAYRVKFRNQGAEPVGKFRVALLAGMDGRVSEDSPRAMVEVAGLASGESKELTIRLPRTAMRLASTANGLPSAFTHLFVAVDIDNAIDELDKTNNVAILERTMLEEAAR